jgi:hypothetical protein
LAEAFGTTNTSQIIDLQANGNNDLTPAYAIYEQGALSKVALINFMDDNQTGTNDLQVTIQVSSGEPQSVQVKCVFFLFFGGWMDGWLIFFFAFRYLSATSVSDRDNITWAGQVRISLLTTKSSICNNFFLSKTLGGDFSVDGLFRGTLNVTTINCSNNGACIIPIPAPGFALVFLSNSTSTSPPQDPYISLSQATKTFSTSAYTKTINTAAVPSAVLATSNGHSGIDREQLGSTSANLKNDSLLGGAMEGGMRGVRPGLGVLVGLVVGGVVAGWALFFLPVG